MPSTPPPLTPAAPAPSLSRALFDELRARMADGTYAVGTALPSTRALAAERGLSRATVALVYEQLAADGFIDTRAGALARVAAGLGVGPQRASERLPRPVKLLSPGQLSQIGQRIQAMDLQMPKAAAPGEIDFVYGPLAGHDFPTAIWLKAQRQVERQRQPSLAYDDPRGNLALRQALQRHLSQTRGLVCAVDQLLIVNGSQQALDLCARLLVDPGDPVAVENPGYRMAHHVFEAYGAQLRWMAVDGHGVQTDQLDALGAVKLVFVTPTHQFPLGAFLPIGRRQALLDWVSQKNAWLIEDDYDSEYRFAVRPEATLQSLDTDGRVIHVGTFSKTLSPQLRLGYMVLPPALVDLFAAAKRLSDRHAATGVQQVLAHLIEDGSYARHVRRIRRTQQTRQEALLAALALHFKDEMEVHGATGGLHLVVVLKSLPASAEPALAAAALRRGVRVYPISPMYHPQAPNSQQPRCCGLVMGYALLSLPMIAEGVARLRDAVAEVQADMASRG